MIAQSGLKSNERCSGVKRSWEDENTSVVTKHSKSDEPQGDADIGEPLIDESNQPIDREYLKHGGVSCGDSDRARKKALKELERKHREESRAAEKKRKDAEREAERKRKELQREETRKRKEAEREAEKRRKEELKEVERRKKEEQKEMERKRKEEEKTRQQPKINNFFKVCQTKAGNSAPELKPESDYEKTVLPFHLKANVKYYEAQHKKESPADVLKWLTIQPPIVDPDQYLATSDVYDCMIAAVDEVEIQKLMGRLDVHHIQFADSLRPPYVGTVQLIPSPELRRIMTQPFKHLDADIDYAYDSELEWIPLDDDDGEDLQDDDESESESDDDEMAGFVDPDNVDRRAQQVAGPIRPVVIWNDQDPFFDDFKIETLQPKPINLDRLEESSIASAPAASGAALLQAVPEEQLKQILLLVQGSLMNQTFLVESLKIEFQSVSKAAILAVIKTYARRVQKQWVLTPKAYEHFEIACSKESDQSSGQ